MYTQENGAVNGAGNVAVNAAVNAATNGIANAAANSTMEIIPFQLPNMEEMEFSPEELVSASELVFQFTAKKLQIIISIYKYHPDRRAVKYGTFFYLMENLFL